MPLSRHIFSQVGAYSDYYKNHSYIGRRDNVSKLEGSIIWVLQGPQPREIEKQYCHGLGFVNPGTMKNSIAYRARKNGLQNVINTTQAGLGRLV